MYYNFRNIREVVCIKLNIVVICNTEVVLLHPSHLHELYITCYRLVAALCYCCFPSIIHNCSHCSSSFIVVLFSGSMPLSKFPNLDLVSNLNFCNQYNLHFSHK